MEKDDHYIFITLSWKNQKEIFGKGSVKCATFTHKVTNLNSTLQSEKFYL